MSSGRLTLDLHDYALFPYELDLAKREVASLVGGRCSVRHKRFTISGGWTHEHLWRLTYFSHTENGSGRDATLQHRLERSHMAFIGRNHRRQSTLFRAWASRIQRQVQPAGCARFAECVWRGPGRQSARSILRQRNNAVRSGAPWNFWLRIRHEPAGCSHRQYQASRVFTRARRVALGPRHYSPGIGSRTSGKLPTEGTRAANTLDGGSRARYFWKSNGCASISADWKRLIAISSSSSPATSCANTHFKTPRTCVSGAANRHCHLCHSLRRGLQPAGSKLGF